MAGQGGSAGSAVGQEFEEGIMAQRIVIVLIGVNARTTDNVTAEIRSTSGVVKAGQPAIYSSKDDKAFR